MSCTVCTKIQMGVLNYIIHQVCLPGEQSDYRETKCSLKIEKSKQNK